MSREFELIKSYKYNYSEKKAADELIQYFKIKFGVQMYKVLFAYNDTNVWDDISEKPIYPSKDSKIEWVYLYFKTNKEFHYFINNFQMINGYLRYNSERDGNNLGITSILLSNGFDVSEFNYAYYRGSVERCALHDTYRKAISDFRKYREKVFNPDTMKYIYLDAMFVEYKSKELLEQAKASGEVDRIKEDYYKFMKERDPFNLISKDDNGNYRHLFTRFDAPEVNIHPIFYDDLMGELSGED